MSEMMTAAVMTMPFELAMNGELSRFQFYQRAQSVFADLQAANAQIDKLRTELLTARADGRSESAAIILDLDPEDALDDCMESGPIGDTGDYSTEWIPEKVHALLKCTDRTYDAIGNAKAEHWRNTSLRAEAEAFAARTQAVDDALAGLLAALPYGDLTDDDLAESAADPQAVAVLAARRALAMEGDYTFAKMQAHQPNPFHDEGHDNLRDQIGQALRNAIESGAETPDWHDSREIDRLADAVLSVNGAEFAHQQPVAQSWTATPPTQQGWYWHWHGDPASSPFILSVLYSGTTKKCFVSAGNPGIDTAVMCDEYGGFWLAIPEPTATTSPQAPDRLAILATHQPGGPLSQALAKEKQEQQP